MHGAFLASARSSSSSFHTTTVTPRAAYSGPINFRAFHPSKTNSLPVFPLIFEIAREIRIVAGIVPVSRNLSNSNLFSCKSFSKFFTRSRSKPSEEETLQLEAADEELKRKRSVSLNIRGRSPEDEGKRKSGSGSVGRVRSRHDQRLMDKFNFSAHCLRLVAVIGAHCSSDRNTRAGEGYTACSARRGRGRGQVGW